MVLLHPPPTERQRAEERADTVARDLRLRPLYLRAALAHIPRLLGAIDRNPYRPTYGCLDRQFWHYRTADFPSEMYQEGVLALAQAYVYPLPGNRWQGCARVRDLAVAALRFSARSSRRDGSCDDYHPFERALGAAVFSLVAAAEAYELLALDDDSIRDFLIRRGRWVARHDESGRLANHHALAALGMLRVGQLFADSELLAGADVRVRRVVAWQSDEGWFDEYGGADPGYQTVTLDALAKYRRLTGAAWLDEPLHRGVAFARHFLHPDGSYGGEYGSRGTHHFYPHGMELLAAENADAADLAEGFLRGLESGRRAAFDDDRMFAHYTANLIGAYLDWSPERCGTAPLGATAVSAVRYPDGQPLAARAVAAARHSVTGQQAVFLPQARLLIHRMESQHTIISAARGGTFKHFVGDAPPITDAGLIVELCDGRVAVSQTHDLTRGVEWTGEALVVSGPLHYARFETATPAKFVAFRLGLLAVGRWSRGLVRRLLQRRLITGRRAAPVRLTRTFEFIPPAIAGDDTPQLRVTDTIELTAARTSVRRMSFGVDHQAAYVAAAGVYQDSVLQPWTDLADHVPRLNAERRVTVVRCWPAAQEKP